MRTLPFRGLPTLAVLVGAAALLAGPAASAQPLTASASGPCVAGGGVTVVVDLTDLGGTVKTGCATGDPATGRAALLAAGFTATDDASGLICAIDAAPDPCPATFAGKFWSYWSAATPTAGTWTAYQTGADASDPARGSLEGWRYSDGSAGPTLTPAAAAAVKQTVAAAAPAAAPAEADEVDAPPMERALPLGLGVIGVAALVALVVRRRRTS